MTTTKQIPITPVTSRQLDIIERLPLSERVNRIVTDYEHMSKLNRTLRAMVDTGECTVQQYQDWERFHGADALASWHIRGRIGEPCWKTPDWFNHNAGCNSEDNDEDI